MKVLLPLLITIFSFSAFSKTSEDVNVCEEANEIRCSCEMKVGLIGLPQSNETVQVDVCTEWFGEESPYETDIRVQSKCISEFKNSDVRKVWENNFSCEFL